MSSTPKTTLRALPKQGLSRLSLLVLGDGHHATHALPEAGELVIGRVADCDVVIDDDSISRRHARVRLGETMTIEDLGSANGTRVRDAWLPAHRPTKIAPGEVVDLGSLIMIIQDRTPHAMRQRRLWGHDELEARIEEECRRVERSGAGFALAKIECASAEHANVELLLNELIRGADVVGNYAPGEYEVILVDTAAHEAAMFERRIQTGLAEAGIAARVGTAVYPADGRDPYALVATACARARGDREVAHPPSTVVVEGAMQQLHRMVSRVAAGTISVLVLGETGVGKEVLAEAIHAGSPRAKKPFLRLNCAALTESLLETELFGHERGAFTGAMMSKPGLLETAHTGSVFLDEVGELPMATQVKLLRVIEAREVMRVGALRPQPIDVRFISATNRDLETEATRGTFRQDLYFRLNGVSLVIPPLRQRTNEIAGLARAFVEQFSSQSGHRPPKITKAAMAQLERYPWPGNIRELRNVIERAALLCGDGPIDVDQLPVDKPVAPAAPPPLLRPVPVAGHRAPAAETKLPDEIERLERQRIVEVLEQCVGNQTRAAEMLGISRRTLTNRMNEFKLPRPRKR